MSTRACGVCGSQEGLVYLFDVPPPPEPGLEQFPYVWLCAKDSALLRHWKYIRDERNGPGRHLMSEQREKMDAIYKANEERINKIRYG